MDKKFFKHQEQRSLWPDGFLLLQPSGSQGRRRRALPLQKARSYHLTTRDERT